MSDYVTTLSFFSKSANINVTVLGGGNSLYDLQAVTASGNVVFSAVGNAFSLDGGAPISLAGLPSGFRVLTAGVRAPGNTPTSQIGIVRFKSLAETAQATVTFGTFGPIVTAASVINVAKDIVVPTITPITPAQLIALFRLDFVSVWNGVGSVNPLLDVFGPLEIFGTYDVLSFTYTPSPASGSSVDKSQLITITSTGLAGSLDLSQLTLSVSCGTIVPIIQTATLLTFLIPAACSGAGMVSIIATGNGIQFSGSYPLATFNVLLTNASGIYTLVENKTNDTLYSSLRDGTTRNVKIPDPFIKTGFVDG